MVTRKDRRDLEGKLLAIQDLKREKYIGTQEAWNYIERVNALYENPVKVADAINEKLEKKGIIYYKATPERIFGLCYTLYDLFINDLFPDYFNENHPYNDHDYNLISEIRLFDNDLILSSFNLRPLKRDTKELSDYLTPIFINVQYPDSTNQDFVDSTVQSLLKINISDKLKKAFLQNVNNQNWDYLLSKENLRKIERNEKGAIYFHEINIDSRINRFERDLVDYKLENRREVLADWIDMYKEELKAEGFEYMIKYLKEQLQRRRETLGTTTKFTMTKLSVPKSFIDKQISLIRGSEFILRCLSSEKRFVEKYLKS